jgi:hypothetical protein
MFDVCTRGDTAHIDTIFKFLSHTRVNMSASIFCTAAMIRAYRSARSRGNGETNKYPVFDIKPKKKSTGRNVRGPWEPKHQLLVISRRTPYPTS